MATAMRGKEKISEGTEMLRDDLRRHRYEEMRNGVEQIRAEEQRQSNANRGGDARSKGKAKYF